MQLRIVWPVPGLIEAVFVVERFAFHEGQDQHSPTVNGLAVGVGHIGGWKRLVNVVIVLKRESNLFEVVAALHAAGASPALPR